MNSPVPSSLARMTAEEVLTRLYGPDFHGCPVPLDEVANVVQGSLDLQMKQREKIMELYETVIASLHKVSTPPNVQAISNPHELNSILSERLDAVREITAKTIETSNSIKQVGQ